MPWETRKTKIPGFYRERKRERESLSKSNLVPSSSDPWGVEEKRKTTTDDTPWLPRMKRKRGRKNDDDDEERRRRGGQETCSQWDPDDDRDGKRRRHRMLSLFDPHELTENHFHFILMMIFSNRIPVHVSSSSQLFGPTFLPLFLSSGFFRLLFPISSPSLFLYSCDFLSDDEGDYPHVSFSPPDF